VTAIVGKLIAQGTGHGTSPGNPVEASITMVIPGYRNDNPAVPSPSIGVAEDEMKRTRRLSIEVEHREVTVTATTFGGIPRDGQPEASETPLTCPACGSPHLLRLIDAIARNPGSEIALSRALALGRVHIASRGSELWLCEPSFEAFTQAKQ
jgi:hypothetical protein